MFKYSIKYLSVCVAGIFFISGSFAQQLEEVFVTAQKRVQALEDVPISITAISGEHIAQANIGNIDSLQNRIPNFRMSTAAVSTEIYIRGVGSGANDGFEQSVGIFVDGVFGGRGRQFRAPFMDLERLEVLRGPQGVLLGKNTIAGAVSITTAKPTDTPEGSLSVSYNKVLDEVRGTAIFSGPLGENTRARLASTKVTSDGYLTNSVDGGSEPKVDDFVVRGSLEHDFTDNLSGFLKHEIGQFDMEGSRFVISDIGPFDGVFEGFDPNFSLADYSSSKGGLGGEDEFDNTENTNSVLQFDWQIPGHTVSSITGYSNFKFVRRLDSDFSPIPMLLTETKPERFEQLSQEFRLLSDPGKKFDYIAGLYWQTNDYDTLRETTIDGDSLAAVLLGPLNNPLGAAATLTTGRTFQKFDQQADSLAAYGKITWNLSDRIRSSIGLRYSKEEKDAVQFIQLNKLDGSLNTNPVSVQIIGLLFGFTNHFFADKRSETDVSPSFDIQFDATDDLMLYGSVAKGFKAGGYNAQERGNDIALFEFEEETAITFEGGFKSSFLDNAARLNVSLFYSKYDNRQVSAFNGVGFVVGNAAESTSKGIEMDGAIAVADGLEFGGSVALLNSEFDQFPDAPCFAGDTRAECADTETSSLGARDITGETTTYAPDYSGNIYVRGSSPLTDTLELSFSADYSFTGGFFYNLDLDPKDFQKAYGMLDARVAIGPDDGKWELALVGQNLTEEVINAGYGADIPLLTGAHFSSSIPPRRVSLTGTIRF